MLFSFRTKRLLFALGLGLSVAHARELAWFLPIQGSHRQSLADVQLTAIGGFGLQRKERPSVPAHLHTGVDIRRPSGNYIDEPIYPAAKGLVISMRNDGPYAQIIVEHRQGDSTRIWTVYEHIAGIRVKAGDSVEPQRPMARFMTRQELDRYGWQFDHVHFEVMKKRPLPAKYNKDLPYYHFSSYGLVCYTRKILDYNYIDPFLFINKTPKPFK